MKVLFYSAYPGYTGSHRMALQIATEFREAGHDVITAAPADMDFLERAASAGLATLVIPAPAELLEFGKTLLDRSFAGKIAFVLAKLVPYNVRALRALRANGIDVVYAAQERAVVQVGIAARLAGVPLIWHIQGGLRSGSGWIHKASHALATKLVCVSEAVAENVAELLGPRARGRMCVIYNGIPDGSCGTVPKTVPPDALRMLFAGNVAPEKGAHHLVRALADVTGSGYENARLRIAGPVPDERYLHFVRSLVAECGLEDRVEILGYREDVPDLIDESDVIICPSVEKETLRTDYGTWEVDWKEGFCLVALEGMRAGRPVIASDSYGLKEVVLEGETGLRVAPGDVDALADAIRVLAGDERLRRRLGESGRRRFERTFRLRSMADGFLKEFETVVSGS